MINQRDIFVNTIKILDKKDVSVINNKDSNDYIYSSLTCEGGGVFKKGLLIGMQDKMIPGLIVYDNENFYGFSDKHGLSLLSTHQEYIQLEIPRSYFINSEVNKLQPIRNGTSDNLNNKMLSETDKIKHLNIDIEFKDSNYFYITIPNDYNTTTFFIHFDISFIYSLDTFISNLSFVIINESDKIITFKILNNNCYYDNDFTNEIYKKTIFKINVEYINENYSLISKKTFSL